MANKSLYNRVEIIFETLKIELESDSESLLKTEKLSEQLPELINENFNNELKASINKLKIIINDSEIKNKNKFLEQISYMEESLEINNNERRKFFNISNTLLKSEFDIYDLKINDNTKVCFYGQQDDCKFSYELDLNGPKIGFKIDEGNLKCMNMKISYILI